MDFSFRKYPILSDGQIDLSVEHEQAADPEKGWVPSYAFRIILAGTHTRIGSISLRVGYTDLLVLYGGHIGYGIDPEYRGQGYAARACLLIKPVARDHGMDTLWITCNPDNWASRRTCEKIGCQFVEIVDVSPQCDLYWKGERQKCRYRWIIY